MWEKLEKVDLKNKEIYLNAFKELIKKVKENGYNYKDKEEKNYFIINEKIRNQPIVHIVPKEIIRLFKEMRTKAKEEFLGFTVLVNDTRVSCFGIPCSTLSKAIINA